jgi:hypothetical protein
MRYMYLVVLSPDAYGKPPPQRLMEEMTKLSEKRTADGSMISSGGLFPPAMGVRVTLKQGKLSVTDGPFAETKEVIGGFAIFEFATREEALQSAIEFMEIHRLYGEGWEGACEMRPMMSMDNEGDCSLELKARAN